MTLKCVQKYAKYAVFLLQSYFNYHKATIVKCLWSFKLLQLVCLVILIYQVYKMWSDALLGNQKDID